jgi:hypothetical protein
LLEVTFASDFSLYLWNPEKAFRMIMSVGWFGLLSLAEGLPAGVHSGFIVLNPNCEVVFSHSQAQCQEGVRGSGYRSISLWIVRFKLRPIYSSGKEVPLYVVDEVGWVQDSVWMFCPCLGSNSDSSVIQSNLITVLTELQGK